MPVSYLGSPPTCSSDSLAHERSGTPTLQIVGSCHLVSRHSIFFMFDMKLASKDSNTIGTCEEEVREETLRSVEDFDGWSSSLPSDH